MDAPLPVSMILSKTEDYSDIIAKYDPTKNKTRDILSRYEKVKIVGLRAEQLQRGAVPMVVLDPENNDLSSIQVAEMELQARVLPFMIRRSLPNGKYEYFKLKDLRVL